MSLYKKIIEFPIELIKTNPKTIMHTSLRNRTFYKSEEIDAPSGVKPDMTYGEYKLEVGLIYLNSCDEIPDDISFLIASKKELESDFLNQVGTQYRLNSSQHTDLKNTFKDIHSYKY